MLCRSKRITFPIQNSQRGARKRRFPLDSLLPRTLGGQVRNVTLTIHTPPTYIQVNKKKKINTQYTFPSTYDENIHGYIVERDKNYLFLRLSRTENITGNEVNVSPKILIKVTVSLLVFPRAQVMVCGPLHRRRRRQNNTNNTR